ncbi:hypothetical protein [uncultured Gimesia sp.]|nr:hypothetical protein [uncultured Gimesia sp.]
MPLVLSGMDRKFKAAGAIAPELPFAPRSEWIFKLMLFRDYSRRLVS